MAVLFQTKSFVIGPPKEGCNKVTVGGRWEEIRRSLEFPCVLFTPVL